MDKETPTQKKSREMAEAVFADPELRERFVLMAKETSSHEAVPDDFSWLSAQARGEATNGPSSEFSRFQSFARKLLAVPKSAIDAQRKKA